MLAPKRRAAVAVALSPREGSAASRPSGKRTFDVCFAVVGLVLSAPLVLGAAALIVVLDGQSPFYLDERVGLGGKRFRCWKLRTMRSNPRILEAYFEAFPEHREQYRVHRKLDNDPRKTVLGEFLRKTSIDELPQFINVLRGEMSVVGPRPVSPAEFSARGASRFLLASVQPGITGIWQVEGRADLDASSRVLLDNYYARNHSFWMDLKIVLRTPVAILSRRGAR